MVPMEWVVVDGGDGMEHPGFFDRAGPFSLQAIADATGATVSAASDPATLVDDIRPLSDAGSHHLSFFENRKYLSQLDATLAGACLVTPMFEARLPAHTAALVLSKPYHGFAKALALFYPTSRFPLVAGNATVPVDPTAMIEAGAIIEPGAVVGPGAQIGRGTRITSGAVVGARVTIGRDCYIGACTSVIHALVGDRVILHSGVRIGTDGFGFAMSRHGHLKVPQIGRVIIQDDVEIGANTTIDRGALKDTIIGEGSKIDNLVQIGHNVIVGRHCIIVSQSGISGSTEIGDFVVIGGQAGLVGHIKVGAGAQIGGASHPTHDVPAGARYFGTPAKPFRESAREIAALKRLGARSAATSSDSGGGSD